MTSEIGGLRLNSVNKINLVGCMRLSSYASRLTSVFALCMIWLQRFTKPLVVAMNKGCHCLSTVLTKSRESKGFLKLVLGKHCTILSNYVKML